MSDRGSRGSGSLAWFECLAGASGDMLLGALVDAGAPLDRMQSAVDTLAVEPVRLSAERVSRHGLAATRVEVQTSGSEVRRTWRDIRELLAGADLPGPVRLRCLDVFTRLARAEAAVHGTAADDVHFHEVGALDAIADVVGVCTALESLGVGTAAGSPVVLGTGRTVTAHGVPPVPVPAVVALLADAGAPVSSGPAPYEMCTPHRGGAARGHVRELGRPAADAGDRPGLQRAGVHRVRPGEQGVGPPGPGLGGDRLSRPDVFPAQYTSSGYPRRAARSWSS